MEGFPSPRRGPTVSVAQAGERGPALSGQDTSNRLWRLAPPAGRTMRPEYDEAVAALRQLQGESVDRNQSAARSLTEGFDETLTLHRLGPVRACC